ncbi:hypothetical protein F5Y18DRAFT_423863 [Xylariaceae sp. FL1019]|nr:hypothetical protein F5Y18DRAFT_423863 [Xylariaceae sp. FL1019]
MQVLASPTRPEVDKAHANGISLDIGVQSPRNLLYVARRKALTWSALGLISTVLHLIWNSIFFESIPFVIFTGAITTSDFLSATDRWDNATGAIEPYYFTNKELIPGLKDQARNFTRVDRHTCIDSYIDPLRATADLVIVAANLTSVSNNGSSLVQGWVDGLASNLWNTATFWICDAYQKPGHRVQFCNAEWAKSFEDQWTVRTWQAPHKQIVAVDYCLLGERGDNQERCGFHASIPLLSVVCFSTLLGVMLLMAAKCVTRELALLRLGDVAASFLKSSKDSGVQVPSLGAATARRHVGTKRRMIRAQCTSWKPAKQISWLFALRRRQRFMLYFL